MPLVLAGGCKRTVRGNVIRKSEAAALRERWKQQADLPVCEHLNQELKENETGYLTGNYHCTTCGETIAKKL
jgi:hypothetical protein